MRTWTAIPTQKQRTMLLPSLDHFFQCEQSVTDQESANKNVRKCGARASGDGPGFFRHSLLQQKRAVVMLQRNLRVFAEFSVVESQPPHIIRSLPACSAPRCRCYGRVSCY